MIVKKIEESGRLSVQEAIHLPVNGISKGWENHTLISLIRLIKKGDEHGKAERLLDVSLLITAPRYIWAELDTYTVGVTPGSSSSTMYTLLKELDAVNNYKDLISLFDTKTDLVVIENFYNLYLEMKKIYGGKNILNNKIKAALPEGFLQTRVRKFSYQTLRRMYHQRKNHRLQWWHDFFDELKKQLNEQTLIIETWDQD
jgi:hypothetical protein